MYGQVVKWFQNHSYQDKKQMSEKKKVSKKCNKSSEQSDDEEAVSTHIQELVKEANKKKYDQDKIARLLSLTYSTR